MPEKNAENVLTHATFLATFREINDVLKVYSNTAVGRAFLASFLATFLARLLTTLLTTLSPEARKSNPRKKNAENVLTHAAFLATFLAAFLARLLTTLLTTMSPQARQSNAGKKCRECSYTRNIPRNIQGNQRRVESVL